MTADITTLSNGMRVVSNHMPHLETVSLGIWVASGARHETEAQNGLSHLLEHMAFKGTARRSARDIAEEIEQVGGELNAATSLEMTAYYARVLKEDIGVALDILADILQNPRYREDELEREREVILQEIAATRDSPDEIAYDLLQSTAFPNQAIGRPILGTEVSVRRIGSAELRSFLAGRYGASRMVLSAAGNVDHAALVRHAEALFGGLNGGASGAVETARYAGGTRTFAKPFEQTHLILGFEGPSYREEAFYTTQVFSGLFGGGMSSRLFQEVRERRGLCYAIYSGSWALADAGVFSIHAATGQDTMDELIDVVQEEFGRIASERPSEAEMARSKAQLKAGLLMGLESSAVRAEQQARQLLIFDRLIAPAELVDLVERQTAELVRAHAERLLRGATPSVVVVGAGPRGDAQARRAADRMAAGL
ncbi:MAG: M16 family metallopeptidase [Hyphomicrobiaceae bacterium]